MMDKTTVLILIRESYAPDALSQMIPTEIRREVFCDKTSVSASEWFDAGRKGLKPAYRVTMFAPDYEGEETVELDGVLYDVYRTYQSKDDEIELYLERKAGVVRESKN